MGQTLSEPVVDKHSSLGGDKRYLYGASAMQGWRISMEDAHSTLLQLGPEGESAFFAVYDGHGGQTAAKFAGAQLHEFIVKNSNYAKQEYEEAIKSGFLAADANLRESPDMNNDSSGCTAVSVLLTKDGTVYCGNAGDSRCIISTKGRAIALSHDHKPSDETEFMRITSGGGFVEFGRVNGNLALSRAIGDFDFKNNPSLSPEKQVVTAYPDVVKHKISADDEFIVVACDGIWDCMTNQQVAQFVHAKVVEGKKLDQICEDMMDRCLASESELGGVGCDNMTVIIVAILNGKTEDEWYAHIKSVAEENGLKSSPKIKKDQHEGSFEVSDLNSDSNGNGNDVVASEVLKHVLQQVSESSDKDEDADKADKKQGDNASPSTISPKETTAIDPLADSPDPSIVDAVKKSESEN